MALALLPHRRERRFGHVLNVSNAGVLARNPTYSPYLPTCGCRTPRRSKSPTPTQ
jgi:hypothetical protein